MAKTRPALMSGRSAAALLPSFSVRSFDYETPMAQLATAAPRLRILSPLRAILRNAETKMDLSRNEVSAKRTRHGRRAFTIFGNTIWEQSEDDVLRATATLSLSEVQKRLPHRTTCAIHHRRGRLHLWRRKLKPWTTREERILHSNIDRMNCKTIASLLPGRSRYAVQSHAWFLGVRKGHLRPPKATGFLVYDEVRNRAYEDRVSLCALDRELGTGKYFQHNDKKRPDWKKLARAVSFFGGQMTVDWKEV